MLDLLPCCRLPALCEMPNEKRSQLGCPSRSAERQEGGRGEVGLELEAIHTWLRLGSVGHELYLNLNLHFLSLGFLN